ncbi:MAG: hemerythrin domain-containing protein [Gammaproteobacteria bacterium]|nr:hemerythrin domain-containing protein [Gammaproteobacteria bacterium]
MIREEHRALAGVLHGLQYLVKRIADGKEQPDFVLLTAMVVYILSFPVRLHHPKEDEYLFSALRTRDAAIVPVLDELEAEHVQDRECARGLDDALRRYEREPDAFRAFAVAVERYAAFQWAHMRKEEDIVLPAAERALLPEDWSAIDSAFDSNQDPLVGVTVAEEFRELFRSIMTAAPAPIGSPRT